MRIDARIHNCVDWSVYHVPTATALRLVVWVDDETNRWAEYKSPLRVAPNCDECEIVEHQARLIKIYQQARLVLIDPVDDHQQEEAPKEISLAAPTAAAL